MNGLRRQFVLDEKEERKTRSYEIAFKVQISSLFVLSFCVCVCVCVHTYVRILVISLQVKNARCCLFVYFNFKLTKFKCFNTTQCFFNTACASVQLISYQQVLTRSFNFRRTAVGKRRRRRMIN